MSVSKDSVKHSRMTWDKFRFQINHGDTEDTEKKFLGKDLLDKQDEFVRSSY